MGGGGEVAALMSVAGKVFAAMEHGESGGNAWWCFWLPPSQQGKPV